MNKLKAILNARISRKDFVLKYFPAYLFAQIAGLFLVYALFYEHGYRTMTAGITQWVIDSVLFVVALVIIIRRLHDMDLSGHWSWIWIFFKAFILIPVSTFINIVMSVNLYAGHQFFSMPTIEELYLSYFRNYRIIHLQSGVDNFTGNNDFGHISISLYVVLFFLFLLFKKGTAGPNKYDQDGEVKINNVLEK